MSKKIMTQEDNTDKPHRVIYYHGPLPRTKVFGNLAKANEFALTVNGTVQLATEKPDIKTKQNYMHNNVKKDKCKCGSSKLNADNLCRLCGGFFL